MVALAVGGIVGAGCAGMGGKKESVAAPVAVRGEVKEYWGTVLSGPRGRGGGDLDLGGALRVEVTWVTVDRVPGGLAPVDTQSGLTFSPANSEAVLSTGVLTRGAEFGAGDGARRFRDELMGGAIGKTGVAGWKSGLVAAGTTVAFDLTEEGRAGRQPRRVGVSISRGGVATTQGAATQDAGTRPAAAGTVAIGIEDFVANGSGGTAMGRETAVIGSVPLGDGTVMAVVAPMAFGGTAWKAVVGLVEVHATGVADAGALAELKENLDKSVLLARANTRPTGAGLDLASAVAALYAPSGLRQPLLFLATQTGARVASEFVLVADEGMLGKLAARTKAYAAKEDQDKWPAGMGWEMDRAALGVMAESLETQSPPSGVVTVLVVWGGEAGRHADVVREILKTSGNRAELDDRLVAENTILLEDNSPGARVRAYDWLNSKGKAPAGFDPLGSAKSRRAALDEALGSAGGER